MEKHNYFLCFDEDDRQIFIKLPKHQEPPTGYVSVQTMSKEHWETTVILEVQTNSYIQIII